MRYSDICLVCVGTWLLCNSPPGSEDLKANAIPRRHMAFRRLDDGAIRRIGRRAFLPDKSHLFRQGDLVVFVRDGTMGFDLDGCGKIEHLGADEAVAQITRGSKQSIDSIGPDDQVYIVSRADSLLSLVPPELPDNRFRIHNQ